MTTYFARCLAAVMSLAAWSTAQENVSGTPIPEPPDFDRSSPETYGRQLADYADLYDTGWHDSYSSSKMTLFDAGGDSVERSILQMILEQPDGDKSVVKFRSPAEIKGVAALTHEHPDATDDNWLYLPATKRVRRISGANKTASFQGTEFTYEDLSNRIVAKYDWRFLKESEIEVDGEAEQVVLLEAVPRYENTGYSKLVIHLNQGKWRQERIDFYDKAGRLLKSLHNDAWELQHGRFWRAMRVSMDNVQTKKRTTIEVSTMLLNLSLYKSKKTGKPRRNLTDEDFTTRALTGKR